MDQKEKKKWIAFFIIGITYSCILYIFNMYHVLSKPAPSWITMLLDHWWIIYLLEFFLPVFLIRFFLHEPLNRYGFHFSQIISQIFLLIFLGNPSRFISHLLEVWNICLIHMRYHYLHTFLPGADFFLALLGQNMLYHGFLLTFFQDIFRNKLAGVLLVGLLYALSSDISSLNLFSFCLSFFYAVLYASIRTFAPGKCTIFSLTFAQYLSEFYWGIY